MRRTLATTAAALLAAAALAAPAQYSKLGIVSAMRRLGRLDAMNAWIQQAGYWDEWLACQVFADDYEGFAAITNAAVATGLVTPAEAATILAESRVTKSGSEQIDALIAVVEADQGLRERYHGGRIGQYVLTDGAGRLIRVDLYRDGAAWTNGTVYGAGLLPDPEAQAKALAEAAAEAERVRAAWEAANLPPDLAALRAAQRARDRANAAAVEE